jgi:NTE family protein
MQDLMFATQSRRAIAAWQAIFDERARHDKAGSATILHVAYADHAREVSGKAFDFSPQSAAMRWQAGYANLGVALDALGSGKLEVGQAGLSVYRLAADGERMEPVCWGLAPSPM